jgi:hypothetical protein
MVGPFVRAADETGRNTPAPLQRSELIVISQSRPARAKGHRRVAAVLAFLLSFGLVGAGVVPPALAATTVTAEVEITAGGADFFFAGTDAMIIGRVAAVDSSLGWPTGSVRIISNEPGEPVSDADLFEFQGEGGIFSGWAYPTEVGDRKMTVVYSGDATFAPKTQVITYRVPPGPITATTLTVSPAGAVSVGQKVTFTSNTTDDEGRPLEGGGQAGWVSFYDNGVRFGEETDVSAGTTPGRTLYASQSTTFTTPGTHSITASFQPSNPYYTGSTSAPLVVTVKGTSTSTPTPKPTATPRPSVTPKPTPKPTATATPPPAATPAAVGGSFHVAPRGPVKAGASVRAMAEIHSKATGKPVSGSVQFYDGNVKVGKPVALIAGLAFAKYAKLTPGQHVLKAKYLGTSRYAAAFTRNVTVTVRK